jgi:hypothetical protein
VTGLRADARDAGVLLTWTAPPGHDAAGWNVYRTPAGQPTSEAPVNAEPISETSWLDTGALPGKSYDYSVRAVLAAGIPLREGVPADLLAVPVIDRFPPLAPGGLVAVQEAGAVRLFWDPSPERDLAGYRVYRRVGGAEWTAVHPDIVREPLFLDTGVAVGSTVLYRVTAIDRSEPPNESPASEPVEIQIVDEPTVGDPAEP